MRDCLGRLIGHGDVVIITRGGNRGRRARVVGPHVDTQGYYSHHLVRVEFLDNELPRGVQAYGTHKLMTLSLLEQIAEAARDD